MIYLKFWNEVPKDYAGIVEYPNGSKAWFLNGKHHREDGPAYESADGTKEWFLNGLLHREDGPAVEKANGDTYWYLNGNPHREDGPAFEWADGSKSWYLNGQHHREDGPAVENFSGRKAWYLNDKCLFRLPPEAKPFVLLEEFVDEEGEERIKVLTQKGIEIWPNLPGLKELADNWEKK